MNKKKKNFALFLGDNKSTFRDKGRNVSQNVGKMNSYVEKSMIVKNSDKSIKFVKSIKQQNKSFDIKQKSFEANDKTISFHKSMMKTLNSETKSIKQETLMTPMFSKINYVKGSKFTDVSKSASFKNGKDSEIYFLRY